MSGARRACGGFCQLALMALASVLRALAWPFVTPADLLTAGARWCEAKAREMGR